MIIKDNDHGDFEVNLSDDGTMDTVIEVTPITSIIMQNELREIRYSHEYGTEFRDKNGAIKDSIFGVLAEDAVEAYIEQYLI